jgi:hypothetical protein
MSQFNPLLDWDVPKQQQIAQQVEKALQNRDSDQACRDVGLCIEKIVLAMYVSERRARPKNMKVAIDFVMDKALVPRPLGAKMHLARELRNIAVHGLAYDIGLDDAQYAFRCMAELFSWINKDELRKEWLSIVGSFDEAERDLAALLQDVPNDIESSHNFEFRLASIVGCLYRALDQAADIKLHSLGDNLSGRGKTVFSRVTRLAYFKIDVRSPAWQALVTVRNHITHSSPGTDGPHLARLVYALLADLRDVLHRLSPLN